MPPPAPHGGSDTPWIMVPTGEVAIVVSVLLAYTMRRRVGVQDARGVAKQVVA